MSSRKSILVVDDDDAVRKVVCTLLERAGHTVRSASGAVEASRLVAGNHFDLALIDIIMPDRDGIELIFEWRRNYPGLRMVAMSGGGRVGPDSYLQMARTSGAVALLRKPFQQEELFRVVDAVPDR